MPPTRPGASGSALRPTGTAWTCSPWPTTRTSVDGEFYHVAGLDPAAAQAPRVFTGSVGPKSLAVTGQLADGWILGCTPGRSRIASSACGNQALMTGNAGSTREMSSGSLVRIMLPDVPSAPAEGTAFATVLIPEMQRCLGAAN